jgi:hypothetical protein
MTNLVAIFYATLILFQTLNISFENVSKFSALIDHASFHKETYGDSFSDFLSEHYGEAAVLHESEHTDHENLPFKNDHQSCTHFSSSFIIQTFDFITNNDLLFKIPFNFFYKESISLFDKPSVFQPPKLS